MDTSLFQHDFTASSAIDKHGRLLSGDWLGRAVRVCLAICLLSCFYPVLAQAVADFHSRQQTLEGFREALRWEPWNPERYADLATGLERPLKDGDLPEIVGLYEHAVQLSPHDPADWSRLGQAYDWAGRTADSQHAFEQAAVLFPGSPTIEWRIGNLYLRQGRTEQGLAALEKVLIADPELRRPAFDLAWRATGDGDWIARKMIPPRSDISFEYLNYLSGTERLDAACDVWNRIVASGLSFESKDALPYLDALIAHRRIDQLISARTMLKERSPFISGKSGPDANLITNGDFENEILDGGLDWRVNRMSGVTVSADNQTFLDGTHSLRIQFEGTQNLSDVLVFQYVPVNPNASYRFEGYMRAQAITTDSGPRLQIRDADDPAILLFQSEGAVGNLPWSRRQGEFKTGPRTGLLEIRVTRPASEKFDNRIAGTVWVDQVSLRLIEK
jgi:tetratricopeptide (TPR) repeat protein